MAEKAKPQSSEKAIPVLVLMLFVVSYILIAVVSFASGAISSALSGLPIINLFSGAPPIDKSPLYMVAPAIGFFIAYFAVDWVEKRVPAKLNPRLAFPVIFIVFALFSFYLGLYWYNLPAVASNAGIDGIAVCIDSAHCSALNKAFEEQGKVVLAINYSNAFSNSSFYLFSFGALMGWLSNYVLFVLRKKKVL